MARCMKHTAQLLILVGIAGAGCGPGGAAEAVRSEAPTANQALGEEPAPECSSVAAKARPLIVDLDSEGRVDLEVAMKSGLPVVHYGCDGLRVLKDCRLPGDFAFASVSLKEDVLQLTSKDEVRANLPISGVKLAGSLERGTSLDLAMGLVGKTTALTDGATKSGLKGECEGATHFVRSATLGAFVMKRGSGAKVAAAADIFVASTDTNSESAKQVTTRDGSIDECRKANPDADAPPAQCRSAIRVELVPLSDGTADEAPATSAIENPCPTGYAFTDGKCTPQRDAKAYLCPAGDEAVCREQCGAGHAGSCYNLGTVLTGVGDSCKGSYDDCRAVKVVPPESPEHARYSEGAKAFEKACNGGVGIACFYVASYLEQGAFGQPKDAARARAMMEKGCAQGDRFACQQLASRLQESNPTDPNAFKFASRACDLGSKPGCFQAIAQLMKGQGVAKDPAKAAGILKRTCAAGEGKRCAELGLLILEGHIPGTDKKDAVPYIERGCELGRDDACRLAARVHGGKMGVPKDVDKARSFLERGCASEDAKKACAKLKSELGL